MASGLVSLAQRRILQLLLPLFILSSLLKPSFTLSVDGPQTTSHANHGNNLIQPTTQNGSLGAPTRADPIKTTRPRIPVLSYTSNHVIINKPHNITVHRSAGSIRHRYVLSTLLKRQLARKVYPVHRLDHRTSGAMVFAFDSKTAGTLHDCLKRGTKEYVALLRGEWWREEETILCDKPLRIDGVEREAVTEFRLLATSVGQEWEGKEIKEEGYYRYPPDACSLVLCTPRTGRTHQIRRHAYAIGHPVLGDTEHGDTKVNRWWRTERLLGRLALHCIGLDLPPLPLNDREEVEEDVCSEEKRIQCVAPLCTQLKAVLQRDELRELWKEARCKEPRLDLSPVDYRAGSHGRRYRERLRREQEEKRLAYR